MSVAAVHLERPSSGLDRPRRIRLVEGWPEDRGEQRRIWRDAETGDEHSRKRVTVEVARVITAVVERRGAIDGYDTDDLVSEIHTKLLEQKAVSDWKGEAKLSTYVWRCASNQFTKILEKEIRTRNAGGKPVSLDDDRYVEELITSHSLEERLAVRAVVSKLDAGMLKLFQLKYEHGMSAAKIDAYVARTGDQSILNGNQAETQIKHHLRPFLRNELEKLLGPGAGR